MSLRSRLIAAILLVLAVSLALAGALAVRHAARQVRTELSAALEVAERTVRSGLDGMSATDDPGPELRRLAGDFDGDRHVRATLLGRNGILRDSRLSRPAAPAPAWLRALVASDPGARRLSVPAGAAGETAMLLRADPASEASEVWAEFRDDALGLALFCVLAAGLLHWTLGRALRPLASLSAGFARIGAGDWDARVPERGASELARLAVGFNRMAGQLAAMRTQNLRLHQQLVTLQEEERAELARDLHDEVGPYLFAAGVDAASIRRIASGQGAEAIAAQAGAIQDAVIHVQQHVRTMLARLRPPPAVELGLEHAIGQLVAFWQARHPAIRFTVEVSAREDSLDDAAKEAAYRIVQESLSNAVRHGRPSRIDIALRPEGSFLAVGVRDDGVGEARTEAGAGFGLIGMRERVAALAGALQVGAPSSGRGWRVTARLPCRVRVGAGAAGWMLSE